ncbi:MAG TPA: HNH endonuclease [Acidimicrobiales bacterium]|nr:HNH endonuclease [Acidimicrobiales bacterium]
MSSDFRTAEYRRNRTTLLADHPVCYWRLEGCTGKATTADHRVARVAGGDDSLANLVPACAHCNYARGAGVTNAKRASVAAVRAEVFGQRLGQQPANRDAISPGMSPDRGRRPLTVADVPKRGRTEPRLATPVAGAGTYGPLVARWARRHMPHRPMPWNRLAWDRVLTHDDGRFVHRQALISVSRQNSKTTWAEALVGWYLTDWVDRLGHDPVTVGWLSHDLKLTEQAFIFLDRLLEHRVLYRTYSFGRQRLELDNGSTLVTQSNSLGAGHGWSLDMVVVDESWKVKPEAVNQGILPAMRARPMPLLVMTSTAGDESSVLLRSWRERGLSLIEAGTPSYLCFLEWSPPPNVDLSQPTYWSWPNPCLGKTLDRETLLAEFQGPDRSAFWRGSLNTWVQNAAGWLEPGWWDRCRACQLPDPQGGVVAAEVSQGGDRFVAVRAWTHDGLSYVAPVIVTEYEDAFWTAVDDAYGGLDVLAITPTLEAHCPRELTRKRVTVGIRELARATPLVRGMIARGEVAHPGSPTLDEHIGRAVQARNAGLSTAHSSGPIELARCAVWALSLASRPGYRTKPALGFSTA